LNLAVDHLGQVLQNAGVIEDRREALRGPSAFSMPTCCGLHFAHEPLAGRGLTRREDLP